MALPAEINSAESGFRLAGDDGGGQCGPHTHEGNVFVLCHDRTNSTIEIWWDAAPTRGEGFAEADSANHPSGLSSGFDGRKRPVWCISGDTAYVIYADASGNLEMTPFYFATKLWGTAITSSITHLEATTSAQGSSLSAEVIPGNKVRVVHNSTQVGGLDSTYYVDIDLLAGSFGTQQNLLIGASSVNYEVRSTLLGIGGLVHCFINRSSPSAALVHISIAPDGTLGSEQAVTTSYGSQWGWDLGAAYYSSSEGVTKLAVPYVGQFTSTPSRYPLMIATADSATDPTWSTATVSDDPALDNNVVSTGTKISCAWYAGDLYVYFVAALQSTMPGANEDQNLYRVIDTGSGLGSPELVFSGTGTSQVNSPRVRAIDIGLGLQFWQIVSANLKPFYDEIAIDPCAGAVTPVAVPGLAY